MPTTSEDACFWYVYSLAVYRISIIFIFLSDEVYANASHFVCPNERGIFSTLYTAYHRKKIFKGLVALTIVSKWFLMFFTDTCYLPIENVDVYIKIWVFLIYLLHFECICFPQDDVFCRFLFLATIECTYIWNKFHKTNIHI